MGFRPVLDIPVLDIDVIGSAYGFPPAGMVAGKNYGTPFIEFGAVHNATGGLLVANPIYVPRTLTVVALECEVTGGAAASNLRMGIYKDDGLGFPEDLVTGSDVSVSTVAAGIKTGVINVSLDQGLYWLAHVRQDVGNPGFADIKGYTGIIGTSGAFRLSGGTGSGWRDGLGNHQGALPNPFPPGAGTIQDNAPAAVRVMMTIG